MLLKLPPTQIKMHEGSKNHPKGTVKRDLGKPIQESERKENRRNPWKENLPDQMRVQK